MPRYLYKCTICNKEFEITRSIKEKNLTTTKCECGKEAIQVYTPFSWRVSGLPNDRFRK